MADYDPAVDAIAALRAKTKLQMHAVARLLKTDGPALSVLRWVIGQADCDRATASMVFWRLLCLPAGEAVQNRAAVLEAIVERARANEFGESGIAWDGLEAVDRTPLVGGAAVLAYDFGEVPGALFGPFRGTAPEPATHAFFEVPYEDDDAFDSLWRKNPLFAAATDWLAGKPAGAWMAAVEELCASHPDELYRWMVIQPECPKSVAGQIFWMQDPEWYSRGMLSGASGKPVGSYASVFGLLGPIIERWSTTGFAADPLDFSRFAQPAKYRKLLSEFPSRPDPLGIPTDLLDPIPGSQPEVPRICEDFDFWYIKRGFSGMAQRPRAAAVAEWELSRKPEAPRGWSWRNLFR